MAARKQILGIWMQVLLVGCSNQLETLPEGQAIVEQVDPSGHSKAFIWLPELGGLGATVSQPYQVWIETMQGKRQRALIFEADKTDGVRLFWGDQNVLEICYEKARVTQFRNFFVVAERNSPQIFEVEIVLRKTPSLRHCTEESLRRFKRK